jgi:hypothetical protein
MHPEGQPKSGKYQSQVMNFLNRQILAIQDRTTKTWRQLKVTLIWGAQVVLYPIYAIVQASRFALHQFTGKTGSAQIPHAPPAADSAIVRILSDLGAANLDAANLDAGNLEDETPTVTAPALSGVTAQAQLPARRQNAPALDQLTVAKNFDLQALQIVGIATDLISKQLVLVTQTWATIALTTTQHHQLTQRISWELAQYGYDYRAYLKRQVNPARLPSRVSSQAWPIVRSFWGLMHWVQESEMALELDWFGEQSLLNPGFTPGFTLPGFTPGFTLPGFTLPGFTSKTQGLPGFRPQAALGGSYGLATIGGLKQTPNDSRIARAIAYFSHRLKLLGAAGAAGAAMIQAMPAGAQMGFNAPQSNLSTETLVDHVLAMQAGNVWIDDHNLTQIPPASNRQKPNSQRLDSQRLDSQRLDSQKLSWRGVFDIDPTDRWIETEAEHMGYIKHPLERLLGWLDSCINWIETKIIAIWKALR